MASLEAILTCNRNLALSISYFSGWMLKKVVLFCIWIYILESDDLKIKNIFIVFTTRSLLMPCNVCPKAKNNVVYKRSSTFPVPVLVIVLIIVNTSTTIRWNKHRELSVLSMWFDFAFSVGWLLFITLFLCDFVYGKRSYLYLWLLSKNK